MKKRPLLAVFLAATVSLPPWSVSAQEIPRRSYDDTPRTLTPSTAVPAPAAEAVPAPVPAASPVRPVAREIVPATALPAQISEDGQTLVVPLNKARIVTLPGPAANVVVANETVADVHFDPNKADQMFVMARSVGSTAIFVMDGRGRVVHRAMIRVDLDTTSIGEALKELLPGETISVSAFGNSVFLRGKVRSPAVATRAQDVAARLIPTDSSLVNMLEVQARQQVALKVRVAEMDRTIAKNLRFSTNSLSGKGFNITTGVATAVRSTADIATGSLDLELPFIDQSSFGVLEQQGFAKTLAEPTLVALSGETANFLVGGEYPFPTGLDDNGNVVFEFREYGISLNFTPVVMGEGNINLQIAMEVSSIDTSNPVTIGNSITVNALASKRTETTVDLPSGGNLMISGLLEDNADNSIAGLPFLKDVPILGTLFRSTQYYRDQTELVVLVSVYQVKPVDGKAGLKLPTDGLIPPTDADLYALGRLYREYADGEDTKASILPISGPFGYILEDQP